MIDQKIEANTNMKKVIKLIGHRIYKGEFGRLEEPISELINSNQFEILDVDVKILVKEFAKKTNDELEKIKNLFIAIIAPIGLIKNGNDSFYNETYRQMRVMEISFSEIESLNKYFNDVMKCLERFRKSDFGYPQLTDNELFGKYSKILSIYKSHKRIIEPIRETMVEYHIVTQGYAKVAIAFEEWLTKIVRVIERAISAHNKYTEQLGNTQSNIISYFNDIEEYL